jgi:anti-sigma28 factor (negative regulator of flagellin synthesis)
MRIDSSPLSLAQAVAQTQQVDQSGGKSRTNGRSAGGDQVQISDMAAQLSTDPARLAELQSAVASGTYHVSPRQLAGSIIDDALQP